MSKNTRVYLHLYVFINCLVFSKYSFTFTIIYLLTDMIIHFYQILVLFCVLLTNSPLIFAIPNIRYINFHDLYNNDKYLLYKLYVFKLFPIQSYLQNSHSIQSLNNDCVYFLNLVW